MFRKLILMTTLALSFSMPAQVKDNLKILFDSKTIEKGCYRIPSLVTAKDGTLIAAADQRIEGCGDLIYNKDINIAIRTSRDGGKTWSPIRKAVDYPHGESASDASMVVDRKNGKIYMFYNYMDLNNAPKIFRQHVVTSGDNGKTWSKAQDITDMIAPKDSEKDFKFITSGRAYHKKDGTIINTLVDLKKGVFVVGSKDNGKVWKTLSPALNPADESTVVEIDKGKTLVNSRVNSYGKRRFHIIDKHGKLLDSFDKPELVDPGCNASMITVGTCFSKNLLFSNLDDTKDRKNLVIRRSLDFGKTWSKPFTVYEGSAAYSSMTSINKKNIGILFEKDDYKEIVFGSYRLKDIR